MKDVPARKALPDIELVAGARAGDMRAMDELVRRHHEAVFRVALGILKDGDQAADATQDAFVKALQGLKRFRGEAKFKTWMLTIAANEAKGALRRRTRRREGPIDEARTVSEVEENPIEVIDGERKAALIKRELEKLPEKQRMAISLRIFEGLSFREVGEVIGSSEGAARVNYHHGIRKLRDGLK